MTEQIAAVRDSRASMALLRVHSMMALFFAAILVVCYLIAVTVAAVVVGEMRFSMWLALVAGASKFWLLVIGIMLVSMQLRQFVSNGVTRHEFVTAAAVLVLVAAAVIAAAVVIGHGLESAVLGLLDRRAGGYPVFGPGELLREFAQALSVSIAWAMSGALIAVGFYRFRFLPALLVMVLGAVPAGLAEGLLGIDETGRAGNGPSYPVSLLISLAATAIAATAVYRLMSDVPLRRTPG